MPSHPNLNATLLFSYPRHFVRYLLKHRFDRENYPPSHNNTIPVPLSILAWLTLPAISPPQSRLSRSLRLRPNTLWLSPSLIRTRECGMVRRWFKPRLRRRLLIAR